MRRRLSTTAKKAPRFVPFQLLGVQDYTHDTKTFKLSVKPSELAKLQRASSGIGPVFHFNLRIPLDDGSVESRPYTPINYDTNEGELDLLIKRYDDGTMTPILHDQLASGSVIELQGPLPGNFVYENHRQGSLTMFAAGTGITPIIQLARARLTDDEASGLCNVYCANKSAADILCKPELDSLEMLYSHKFKVWHTVEDDDSSAECPPEGAGGSSSNGLLQGRISRETLRETKLCAPRAQDHAVVCGPSGFNDAVMSMLLEHGYAANQITVC